MDYNFLKTNNFVYLKEITKEEIELVTNCDKLKLKAEDGKMRITDITDTVQLFQNHPIKTTFAV